MTYLCENHTTYGTSDLLTVNRVAWVWVVIPAIAARATDEGTLRAIQLTWAGWLPSPAPIRAPPSGQAPSRA